MRGFIVSVCLLVSLTEGFGQQLILHTPYRVEASLFQPVSVRIEVNGIKKYTVTLQGQPSGSTFTDSHFVWTPQPSDKRYYLVTFSLLDSLGNRKNEISLELFVRPRKQSPSIEFDRQLSDTIPVEESKPFYLSARLINGSRANQPITPYFIFNENTGLRSFDSCRIEQMGDQLLFRWVPSNAEAERKYARLKITLLGSDSSVASRVLTFKIKNIDSPPSFRYPIPDTVILERSKETVLDFTADDDEQKKLSYDYHPKRSLYRMSGSKIIFSAAGLDDSPGTVAPIPLTVTVSDGTHPITKKIWIILQKKNRSIVLGDFTRKDFEEGDSLITYLNVSGDDLDKYDFNLNDLALPPGTESLAKKLVLQKNSSFIKVKSTGVLPYTLVDKDYIFNLAFTATDKNDTRKHYYKVVELSVKDRPDPTHIGKQKDSLLFVVDTFLKTETIYKSMLDKMQGQINRPWWKKAAVITGALSGVIGLVQSQEQNKSISAIAAVISLASITVTNLPSLTEKTLSELTDKIANSKGRIDQLQESESAFRASLLTTIDQTTFYRLKSGLSEKLTKAQLQRSEDICSLWSNNAVKRRIIQLLKSSSPHTKNGIDMKKLFFCADQK